jgi:hypothetical protein
MPVLKTDSMFVNRVIPNIFAIRDAIPLMPIKFFSTDGANCVILDTYTNSVWTIISPDEAIFSKLELCAMVKENSRFLDKLSRINDGMYLVDCKHKKILYDFESKEVKDTLYNLMSEPKTEVSIGVNKDGNLIRTINGIANLPCCIWAISREGKLIKTPKAKENNALRVFDAIYKMNLPTYLHFSVELQGEVDSDTITKTYHTTKFYRLVNDAYVKLTAPEDKTTRGGAIVRQWVNGVLVDENGKEIPEDDLSDEELMNVYGGKY